MTKGMRGKDMRSFMIVARKYQVLILIRHTNDDSLRYINRAGFYPKPAVLKAKTADFNPPSRHELVGGKVMTLAYQVSGLVVHPGFQPDAYQDSKKAKAYDCWDATMKTLSPTLKGKRVDLRDQSSWSYWGVIRQGVHAKNWHWCVDVDRLSPQFGCIRLQQSGGEWCYIHGDYDLKDVIVPGNEWYNERNEGKRDGVLNFTPKLPAGRVWETIRDELNAEVGVEMVQHGAEAQFAWHGDEPITVLYPDWRFEILADGLTVQGWYERLQRNVLAQTGVDYRRDPARIFIGGPDGLVRADALPEGFDFGGMSPSA